FGAMIPGFTLRANAPWSLLAAMLPVGGHLSAGLVEVDVLIDMIDPGHRNEVMVCAIRRTLFGQLDLVGPLEMVDLPDRPPVRRDDVHVFLDLGDIHVA